MNEISAAQLESAVTLLRIERALNRVTLTGGYVARHISRSRLFWNPLSKQRKLQWWMIGPEGWQYVGQAKRKNVVALKPPEERAMSRMGIDPERPEEGIARRILSNMHLKSLLGKLQPENRRIAYDKLKPLLLFEVLPFEQVCPEESVQ